MRQYNTQPQVYPNISIEALKTQLAVNLLLQNQPQFGNILGNVGQTTFPNNSGSLNHISSILNTSNTNSGICGNNEVINGFRNRVNLSQPIPYYANTRVEGNTFGASKVLPIPTNFSNTLVDRLPPIKTVVEPLKEKFEETRQHSLSVDQTTQDLETKAGDTPSSPVAAKPSSLVFNIRRYNKKQKKFILLTRHRKLITKCEHTSEEYYAKGMCKKCYHNKGERSKFATTCGHTDKFHYAKGLCKGCYLTDYHRERKTKLSK